MDEAVAEAEEGAGRVVQWHAAVEAVGATVRRGPESHPVAGEAASDVQFRETGDGWFGEAGRTGSVDQDGGGAGEGAAVAVGRAVGGLIANGGLDGRREAHYPQRLGFTVVAVEVVTYRSRGRGRGREEIR